MELNFSITNIDFYRLTKEECYELARSYSLKLPPHPNLITQEILRPKLAVVKDIFKLAQLDKEFASALHQLVYFNSISDKHLKKYPQLTSYQELFESTYETVDNDLNAEPHYQNQASSLSLQDDNLTSQVLPQVTYQSSTYDSSGYLKPKQTTSPNLHATPSQGIGSCYENRLILEHEALLKTRKEYTPEHQKLSLGNRSSSTESLTQNLHTTADLDSHNDQPPAQMANDQENIPLVKPTSFSGLSHENVQDFITKYNLVAKVNRWKNQTKIDLLSTYVNGYAEKWLSFYLKQNPAVAWDTLETEFLKAFGKTGLKIELQTELENRIQSELETPLQFFYIIRDICYRIDSNMTDDLIINHTIKGLNPSFFDKIVALNNTDLTTFQENLSKIEQQLQLKQQNAKKFGTHFSGNSSLALHSHLQPNFSHGQSSVRFENEQHPNLVSVVASLERQLSDLKLEKNRSSRRDFSPHKNRAVYKPSSPGRSGDRNSDRSTYYSSRPHNSRTNYRPRHNDSRRFPTNSQYRPHYDQYRHKSPGRRHTDFTRNPNYSGATNRRFNCEICYKDNHSTINCYFNPRNDPDNTRFRTKNKNYLEKRSATFKSPNRNSFTGQNSGMSGLQQTTKNESAREN